MPKRRPRGRLTRALDVLPIGEQAQFIQQPNDWREEQVLERLVEREAGIVCGGPGIHERRHLERGADKHEDREHDRHDGGSVSAANIRVSLRIGARWHDG